MLESLCEAWLFSLSKRKRRRNTIAKYLKAEEEKRKLFNIEEKEIQPTMYESCQLSLTYEKKRERNEEKLFIKLF